MKLKYAVYYNAGVQDIECINLTFLYTLWCIIWMAGLTLAYFGLDARSGFLVLVIYGILPFGYLIETSYPRMHDKGYRFLGTIKSTSRKRAIQSFKIKHNML